LIATFHYLIIEERSDSRGRESVKKGILLHHFLGDRHLDSLSQVEKTMTVIAATTTTEQTTMQPTTTTAVKTTTTTVEPTTTLLTTTAGA